MIDLYEYPLVGVHRRGVRSDTLGLRYAIGWKGNHVATRGLPGDRTKETLLAEKHDATPAHGSFLNLSQFRSHSCRILSLNKYF